MIKKLLNREAVFLDLESNTKDEALMEISTKLFKKGFISDKTKFLQALIYREELMNTALNNGISVPHGVSSSVIKPVISISISKEGIDWFSEDLKPVNVIFTLALQKHDKNLQIDALQMIALYAVNNRFNKEIMKAKNESEVLETFLKHYPESL